MAEKETESVRERESEKENERARESRKMLSCSQ